MKESGEKVVGIFPNPYAQDEWNTVMHPVLSYWADSLMKSGWKVAGLETSEIMDIESLKKKELSAVIIHWTETLTKTFISRFFSGKILTSRLSRLVPLSFKKRPSMKMIPEVMTEIDNWAIAISGLNVKIFFQIHELVSHGFYQPGLAECDKYLKKKVFDISSGFITMEHSSVPLIFDYYKIKKPYTVSYPGDYADFHGVKINKAQARMNLRLKDYDKIFSYIGTVRKNRNPEETVESFMKIADEKDFLIVAGLGTGRYVKHKTKNIKVFNGLIPNEQLRDIFCASDFVINDAREYMTSAIVRTAMSYGVPVIVRHYGASVDMAKNASIIIEETDDGLTKALQRALMIDNDEYNIMCKEAETRNNERPWEQYGKAFNGLYQSFV